MITTSDHCSFFTLRKEPPADPEKGKLDLNMPAFFNSSPGASSTGPGHYS